MKRLVVLLAILPVVAAPASFAQAEARGTVQQEDEQQLPVPTPLEDPYAPPAGDPDIFAPEPSGEPSPLNPAGD